MLVTEKETFPVQYEDILVFPEYFMNYMHYNTKQKLHQLVEKYNNDEINYYVIGAGKSYGGPYTSVILFNREFEIVGVRQKISIFFQEGTEPAKKLEVFSLSKYRRLGIVICKEVLHTAIAEVMRMMKTNIIAVTIGGGDFWNLQRDSWIDQMTLFSDICKAPLVCACGATKQEGGINLVIQYSL
jgi:predicted amidohydrolase